MKKRGLQMVAVNLRHGTIELWDLKQKRSLTSTRPHADTCAMVDVSRSIQLEDFHRPAAVGSQKKGIPWYPVVCHQFAYEITGPSMPFAAPNHHHGLWVWALCSWRLLQKRFTVTMALLKIRQVESSLSHSQDSGRAWLFADPMAPNDADHVWSCFYWYNMMCTTYTHTIYEYHINSYCIISWFVCMYKQINK